MSSSRPLVLQLFPMMEPSGEAMLREHVELRTATDASAATVIREGRGAVAIIGRSPARIGPEVMDALPSVLVMSATGSGADWVDLAAARERGIPVLHNPGVAPTPVTEYVIGAMVVLFKRLREADAFLRAGGAWEPKDRFRGRELHERRLGIVGLGHIGSDVARRAAAAFDMKVTAYDPLVPDEDFAHLGVDRAASIDELFATADVISLHVPLLPSTRHVISAAELRACKAGAVLINVARGGVVDEEALYEALSTGKLAGAAVDVFDPEPPRSDNPLFSLPNVLVTPHIAGLTTDAMAKLGQSVAVNVVSALRGERPAHLVDPTSWPPRRGGGSWPLGVA